jgi:hypothetical protein
MKTMVVPDFVIRDCSAEDVPGIAALQRDVDPELQLPAEQFIAFWQWLCRDSPFGAAKSLVGTDGGGEVIAHEAVVPFPVERDGRQLASGLPCQLVVARHFRGKPVFLQMELRLMSEYPRSGIDFVAGIVRDRILRAHLALGFRVVGQLPVYARPYRVASLARHYLGPGLRYGMLKPLLHAAEWPLRICLSGPVRRVEVARIEAFDDEAAASLEAVSRQLGMHTRRSAALLNWRFFDCPDRSYQVYLARGVTPGLGYVALRPMRMHDFEALAVVDLVFPPDRPDVGRALLRQMHRVALETRVDLAACMLNPASPLLPVLRRFGFLRTPEAFSLVVHQPKGSPMPVDAETFQHWHYTWLDHDYV